MKKLSKREEVDRLILFQEQTPVTVSYGEPEEECSNFCEEDEEELRGRRHYGYHISISRHDSYGEVKAEVTAPTFQSCRALFDHGIARSKTCLGVRKRDRY